MDLYLRKSYEREKNVSFDNSDKKRHFALKDKLSKMTTPFQPANKNSRSALENIALVLRFKMIK